MDDLKSISPVACDAADTGFRAAFGSIVTAYKQRSGRSNKELHESTRPRLTQGNEGAVRDLANGLGWIEPAVATELFVELGIPDASELGDAYRLLKDFVDGRTEPHYRAKK